MKIVNDNDINKLSMVPIPRESSDRRRCPTPVISKYTFTGGKRKKARREGDKKKCIFVDLYSTRLLIAVSFLLSLSCVDAYLTLALIEKGSVVELNPLMASFLNVGVFQFSLIKFIITALSLIILCLFKNVNITRIAVPVIMEIYLIVIVYEFYLYII
jgi:hypothetical protein